MDAQLKALIWTLAFDIFLFLMAIACFFCIRKRRGDGLFNFRMKGKQEISEHFEQNDLRPSVLDISLQPPTMQPPKKEKEFVEMSETHKLLVPPEHKDRTNSRTNSKNEKFNSLNSMSFDMQSDDETDEKRDGFLDPYFAARRQSRMSMRKTKF